MKSMILTWKERNATRGRMERAKPAIVALAGLGLAGCVQVSAPEEPIVIELNITVDQTIDVNLREDVQDLIENNPELFPE